MKDRSKLAIGVAFISGILIGMMDSSRNWNDTGVSAAAIVVVASVMSFMAPRVFVYVALASSVWVPILGWRENGFGTLLALLFGFGAAFVGSSAGWFVRKGESEQPIAE